MPHLARRFVLFVVLAAGLAGCAANAPAHESTSGHTIALPDALVWVDAPASLPAGARMAVLAGDPTQAGPFTLRFEMPAGYEIRPHTHPRHERVTVLSGAARLGMGETFDRANATPLPTGSFFEIPPGMAHFFVAGEETVVIQLQGEGPWGIVYVDPADDPRAS